MKNIDLSISNIAVLIFVEKNNMDLGINIADDLEELKNNLNKFKKSKERTSLEVYFKFSLFYIWRGDKKKGSLSEGCFADY